MLEIGKVNSKVSNVKIIHWEQLVKRGATLTEPGQNHGGNWQKYHSKQHLSQMCIDHRHKMVTINTGHNIDTSHNTWPANKHVTKYQPKAITVKYKLQIIDFKTYPLQCNEWGNLYYLFAVRRKTIYHVELTFLQEVQNYGLICPDYLLTVLFRRLIIAMWLTIQTAQGLSELL